MRELWDRLGLPALLDAITVKKRRRGSSPAQAILALCETLIAGGDCLDDAALLRADAGQERLRGHGLPDPTTLGRFLARFNLGHIGQLNRALDRLFARVHPLLGRGERVTLGLDSTLVEHHGPVGSRQGTRGTYTGKVAWHPLCCFLAETGEWLHAKLRNGHAAPSTAGAALPVRVPAPPARRERSLPARRRGLRRPALPRRPRARRPHLHGRRSPARLAARSHRRDPGARLAALQLLRRERGGVVRLEAEDLEPRATLRRPPRPGRGRRAALARGPGVALLGAGHQRS